MQNKLKPWIELVSKNAACVAHLQSWMLCCTFIIFGAFFTYINTKTVAEQLQGARNRFFSIIMVSILDKDQDLIQIKWLEKMQHNENV